MTTPSRKIDIFCEGRRLTDGTTTHDPVDLASLVSYYFEGVEWWDADQRAERAFIDAPRHAEPMRADIAEIMSMSADRFKIACPECPMNLTSGDHLGAGYRTQAQMLAEYRSGVTSAMKLDRQRPNHERLSLIADSGVSRLSVSDLRRILST